MSPPSTDSNIPCPIVEKAIEDRNKKYPDKTFIDSTGVGDPFIQSSDIKDVKDFNSPKSPKPTF